MTVVQFPGTRRHEPESPPADELRQVELEIARLQLNQMRVEFQRSNALWMLYCLRRVLFWGFILWLLVLFAGTAKADPWRQRSYYDGNGSFAGSSSSNGKNSSYYDRQGRFSGSSIRYGNRENFYDKSGRLVSTTIGPRR